MMWRSVESCAGDPVRGLMRGLISLSEHTLPLRYVLPVYCSHVAVVIPSCETGALLHTRHVHDLERRRRR